MQACAYIHVRCTVVVLVPHPNHPQHGSLSVSHWMNSLGTRLYTVIEETGCKLVHCGSNPPCATDVKPIVQLPVIELITTALTRTNRQNSCATCTVVMTQKDSAIVQ